MHVEQSRQLLQRLASDAAFRAAVQSNPAGALSEYGLSADQLPPVSTVRLPSEHALLAAASKLQGESFGRMAILHLTA